MTRGYAMTNVQSEKAFQQRLNKLLEDQNDNNRNYSSRLQEKGVEYAIVLPLLENVLDYDPLEDIKYEFSSEHVYDQRFDFLLDDRIVLETKALGNPLTKDVIDQITRYISKNDEISYGILTNGLIYDFFVQRTYIQNVANKGQDIIGAKKNVYNVLTLEAGDERFFEVVRLFSKSSYQATFEAISKYVFKQIVPTPGKDPIIVSDKKLNEYIKENIRSTLDFKKGYYLDQIRKGELEPDTKLCYKDDFIGIEAHVQSDGTILIPKGSVKVDANKIMEDGTFRPLLNNLQKWFDQDRIFYDPKDIFREASGKQKIFNKDWYLEICS